MREQSGEAPWISRPNTVGKNSTRLHCSKPTGSTIEEKIQVAENGMQEFSRNHGGTPEENQAIVDSLERTEDSAERSYRVAGIETGRLGGSQPSLFSSPAVTKCADCGAAICSDCCVECCGGRSLKTHYKACALSKRVNWVLPTGEQEVITRRFDKADCGLC